MKRHLLAVLALVLSSTCIASQHPLLGHQPLADDDADPGLSEISETIVSILSESAQHTTLIHLLQRSKCIPMLAHIGEGTLFAPTDKAWEDWAAANRPGQDGDKRYLDWLGPAGLDEWRLSEQQVRRLRLSERPNGIATELDVDQELDNQNWALRQHLLYHMLNYTLSPDDLLASNSSGNITTLTTLLYPLADEPHHPRVPVPGAPWLPQGGDGMLGGHGQRLRYVKAGSEQGGEGGKVGGDWKGEGGSNLWDGSGWKQGNRTDEVTATMRGRDKRRVRGVRWGTNGAVVGIEGVLDTPPSIEDIIRNHPSLAYLSRLLPPTETLPSPLPSNLSRAEHVTLFAPSNEAFEAAFDHVEKRYLEGDFGAEGVARVVSGGVVLGEGRGEVGWTDYWSKHGETVGAVSGDKLEIQATPNGSLVVNGTEALMADIFASNGVVHIMPSLLIPENFTLLNSAEKVLLSHNSTRFVSLLRTANLSAMYAGEKGTAADQPWTILAPTDDVLNAMDRWGGGGPSLPITADGVITQAWTSKQDAPLAALLRYHIIPGRLLPDEIKDGMLVPTELQPASLAGGRQHLRVDVAERFDRRREQWDEVETGEIRFEGTAVLGKPIKSGKSIIYFISSLLSPPEDVLQSAVADLQLSTFVAAVYAAELGHTVKNTPGTTFFVPRNRAFASLGLTMRYLLAADGKDELRKVLKYHAVNKVVYSDGIEVGRESYRTLEGGNIVIERTKGGNYTLSLSSPNRWEGHDSGDAVPANGEVRPALITQTDSLTSTGAIHIIDSVVMPADVQITIGKLIQGTKQKTMVDLILRAGLGWILEGREPTSGEIQRTQLDGIVRAWDNETDTSPDIDSLALPAYTVLCPTDKAFSRINISAYTGDDNRQAMIDLLKLHIIPTQPAMPRTEKQRLLPPPPSDGSPLSLADDLVYQTLLSSSSKYGDVAFRATGDNSFLVGIRNARSGLEHDAARLGERGRATVRWRKSSSLRAVRHGSHKAHHAADSAVSDDVLWRGGMTVGGGVIMIDSVLVPYEPSFFSRWGWLILALSGISVIVLITLMTFVWWWMTRTKGEEEPEGYEPLEGEEEE